MIVVGRLVGIVDSRILIASGFCGDGLFDYRLGNLNLDVAQSSLVGPNIISGLATAFVFVPMTTTAMDTLREEQMPHATGLQPDAQHRRCIDAEQRIEVIMKILVAIDSSASMNVILSHICARPWPQDALMCVLNVINLNSPAYDIGATAISSGHIDMESLMRFEAEVAQTLVSSAAERLAARGIKSTTSVVEGYPKRSVVEYAEQWGADSIIIGSHGHGGITRFLLGSIARAVLRHARCSVEIVRPDPASGHYAQGMKILLSTDGSHCSLAAARSVSGKPWPKGSEVKVISVVDVVVPLPEPIYGVAEIYDYLQDENRRRAKASVQSAEKILSRSSLRVSGEILSGLDPKAEILDEAARWCADLIVVGTHGRHGVSRVMHGSVSEAVAMHAHCSVDVVCDCAHK